MKTLKITVTSKDQEEALQNFLDSRKIPYREDVPEPFEGDLISIGGAAGEKKPAGSKDAWRFGT